MIENSFQKQVRWRLRDLIPVLKAQMAASDRIVNLKDEQEAWIGREVHHYFDSNIFYFKEYSVNGSIVCMHYLSHDWLACNKSLSLYLSIHDINMSHTDQC